MNSLKLGSRSGLETLEGSLLKYRRIARKNVQQNWLPLRTKRNSYKYKKVGNCSSLFTGTFVLAVWLNVAH